MNIYTHCIPIISKTSSSVLDWISNNQALNLLGNPLVNPQENRITGGEHSNAALFFYTFPFPFPPFLYFCRKFSQKIFFTHRYPRLTVLFYKQVTFPFISEIIRAKWNDTRLALEEHRSVGKGRCIRGERSRGIPWAPASISLQRSAHGNQAGTDQRSNSSLL